MSLSDAVGNNRQHLHRPASSGRLPDHFTPVRPRGHDGAGAAVVLAVSGDGRDLEETRAITVTAQITDADTGAGSNGAGSTSASAALRASLLARVYVVQPHIGHRPGRHLQADHHRPQGLRAGRVDGQFSVAQRRCPQPPQHLHRPASGGRLPRPLHPVRRATTAPELRPFSLSPATIDTSTASKTVTVRHVTDDATAPGRATGGRPAPTSFGGPPLASSLRS